MKATRIYADAQSVTHFSDFDIPVVDQGMIGRLSERQPGAGVIFRETDESYDYDWHPAPARQWLILLNGRISIETGDGEIREFSGGDILLLEDENSRGHRSRQLSKGIRHSLFVPIE